ncbi:MAG TPA: glycosyltransferase family 1 protein [Pyrinomonadaceae bacterium]|nr:glycosyltransferase family 1 protein [Pyrinomonadaceae bacterium]
MRIGIDGIPLATPKTGIGHYTFELAHTLAAIAPEDEFEIIAPVPLNIPSPSMPPNLRTVLGRTGALRRRWWTIGLPLHVHENRLPLFHGTNYMVPLWQRCLTIVTIHDLSLLLHSDTHREDLVRRAKRRLPTMTRIASHVLTDSEAVKKEICEHLSVNSDKITAVPLAARRAFTPVPQDETFATRQRLGVEDDFILFVGTVEPRKNLITLVRAFDELMRSTDLRPQLVVAGQKGWLTDDLYAHVEQSEIKNRILFTGYVSDDDLASLYSSCTVSVYPSLYEGFGLPPLEAMACGAPVITSRIPVIMETASGAARLVEPTNLQELTAALVELLTDQKAREHYSSVGQQRAAEFTWERTAQKTLEVYHRVCAEAGGRHVV